MKLPRSHPRYQSMKLRHRMTDGLKEGYVAEAGLVAHGRGEAYDYLLGEKTHPFAHSAERAAVALMLASENPVISVNGNAAALVPKEMVRLSKALSAKLEVNLFYRTEKREKKISAILKKAGAKEVYGVGEHANKKLSFDSPRRKVDSRGIWSADTVLVPLEDGDRAEALTKAGKKVIAIDLNPLSRTSQTADVTIVDNIVRAIPNMVAISKDLSGLPESELRAIVCAYDNRRILEDAVSAIRAGVI